MTIDAFKAYWRVAISPTGAVILAFASIDAFWTHNPHRPYVFAFGVLLTLLGAILQATYTSSNRKLSADLEALRDESLKRRNQRVFVILSAFTDEFQVELNFALLRIGRENGLFLQVFCPVQNFSDDSHMISQGFILNNAEQFSGGILIASVFGDGHIEELNAFARGITIPLVIVDHIPPPAVKGDASNTSPSNVVWVTASDLNGGHKAAEAVGDLKIDPTRILVVAGPAKADRQNGFKASIEHRWPACRVRVTTNGGFDRQTAEQVAHNLLSASIKDSSLYDVVFCTSDAMTLGVLDAIASLDWTKCAKPHVIGYDGIAATKRLVLRQDSPLKRVVVQDAKAMASEAVQALLKLKSKLAVPQTIWIEPTLFLDVNELVDRDPALVDP